MTPRGRKPIFPHPCVTDSLVAFVFIHDDPHVTVVFILQQNHVSHFSPRGGVQTPCKTHRKTHRKIPRCFDPAFASDDPSRLLVILPAAHVGCPDTDDPSRVPIILPAARVGFPYTDDPSRVPIILPAARVGFAFLKRR